MSAIDQNMKDPNNGQIDMNNDYEVKVWSQVFDITPGELKEAVKQVGTNVADVERYVKSYIKPTEKY